MNVTRLACMTPAELDATIERAERAMTIAKHMMRGLVTTVELEFIADFYRDFYPDDEHKVRAMIAARKRTH